MIPYEYHRSQHTTATIPLATIPALLSSAPHESQYDEKQLNHGVDGVVLCGDCFATLVVAVQPEQGVEPDAAG